MPAHLYRVEVFNSSSTGIALTFGTSYLAEVPERFGGQRINLLEGRVESLDWTFRLADVNEYVSQQLAGSSGYAHLLARRVRVSRSVDGSTYSPLATGRLLRVDRAPDLSYVFSVSDERLIERNTMVFTSPDSTGVASAAGTTLVLFTNTAIRTRLWPELQLYMETPEVTPALGGTWRLTYDKTQNGYKRLVVLDPVELPPTRAQLIQDDLRPGVEIWRSVTSIADDVHTGAYKHLRLVLASGAELEIVGWTRSLAAPWVEARFASNLPRNDNDAREPTEVWVYDPDNDVDTSGQGFTASLQLIGAPPTPQLPFVIGARPPTALSYRVSPFRHVRDVYRGSYQSTADWEGNEVGRQTVAFSTRTLSKHSTSNPAGLIDDGQFPAMSLRIEKPLTMEQHLNETVYKPLLVLPVVNARGQVEPINVRLRAADIQPTSALSSVTQFGSSNCVAVPTWSHPADQMITHVTLNYDSYTPTFLTELDQYEAGVAGLDGLSKKDQTLELKYSKALPNIRRELTFNLHGYHSPQVVESLDIPDQVWRRYGRGAQLFGVRTIAADSTVQLGDYVKLRGNLELPNTVGGGRGGGNVLGQVINKTYLRNGVFFEVLHVGVEASPIPAPTLVASAYAGDSAHSVQYSITRASSLDEYELQVAESSAAPISAQYQHVATGRVDETVIVSELPMGRKFWGRARAQRVGRVGSTWSGSTAHLTVAVPAPSGLTATTSEATGYTIPLSWTVGHGAYETDILLGSAATSNVQTRLPAGSAAATLNDLTPGTSYTAYAWHHGPYGGHSAASTGATFTTLSTGTAGARLALDRPNGIRIIIGTTPSPTSSS